jgi:uncharacterized protein DUF4154
MTPSPSALSRSSRTIAMAIVLHALALLWAVPSNAGAADGSAAAPGRECEIKAAFLYNFTKFVDWPAQTFANADAPLVIGVLGASPCVQALERLVRDRKVNGRTIVVRPIASAEEAKVTQLLFVGSAQETQFAGLKAAIESLPVLTVGESPRFATLGGAIDFVPQDDKIRFEININAAEHAGLKISAQLQKLAAVVHRSPT